MPDETRPTPEEMLARARTEAEQRRRGKHKIFFGFSPGVGKTYGMLEAARQRRKEGLDVVIGWVETHGRRETEALAEGFDRIPPRIIEYRGVTLKDFDLDAALARHPALLLVDELAHTNAPDSKHARRFQDVEDILDAGIDVYSTLNVQHLESLNDVIAQVSGVVVRETVPDLVFEAADEVELVDLTPDELLQRLREGKVYIPEQAERALEHFFKKVNLIALRELALQRTAERVDVQMTRYRREQGIVQPWLGRERVMVAIGPAPQSANLIRAAYRMATRLRAPWIAAFIETPAAHGWPQSDRDRLQQHLVLAEELGAERVVLTGDQVASLLLQLARQRNVTRIVVGKPTHPRWRDRLRGSLVDDLVRGSGPIDVLVTTGEEQDEDHPRPRPRPAPSPAPLREYALAVSAVLLATAVCSLASPVLAVADKAMVYLGVILLIASRYSRTPVYVTSLLSVAALDFFFVPPYFTLAIADTRYAVTFGVLLLTGVLVSRLTLRIRSQAGSAQEREQRSSALYALTRTLAFRRGLGDIAETVARHAEILCDTDGAVWIGNTSGQFTLCAGAAHDFTRNERETAVARWVLEHGRPAGHGTDTLPNSEGLYLPLKAGDRTLGVLGVRLARREVPLSASQYQLLEVFVSQAALALERALLAEEAERIHITAETERLRNALLSTMSHDLRTPITAIKGASSTLLDATIPVAEAERRELLDSIREEADRLDRIVRDLLDLTRIESGALQVNKEWCPLDEIVGAALTRMEDALRGRVVEVRLPESMVLVPVDPVLLEQVFTNLLENAAKYTPAGAAITIEADARPDEVEFAVMDKGPGVPPEDMERIFEKFYRITPDRRVPGTGLGLSICRAVLTAHGGRIWVENRPGGGAAFRFVVPLDGGPHAPPPP